MRSKIMVRTLIVAATMSATLGVAAAAEPVGKVARLQGTAVVSQGAQYVTAREGMQLREGDRLMALEGGAVTIQFADGCLLTLTDNDVFTVGTVSSCASGAVGSYAVDPSTGVATAPNAAGYLRRAAMEPPTPPAPPPVAFIPAAAGVGWVPLAIGAAVVTGVVIAVNDDDDDRDPISP